MDNLNSIDLTDSINEVINMLTKVRQEIFESIVTLLMDGELKQPPNTPLGETYPFNYELCAKESLDPNIQLLNGLINNIDSIEKKLRRER